MERGVRSAGAATEMDAQSQSEISISYRQKEEKDAGVWSAISINTACTEPHEVTQRFSETTTQLSVQKEF